MGNSRVKQRTLIFSQGTSRKETNF